MQRKRNWLSWFFIIVVVIALFFIYNIYKENYFGDFVRAEYNLGVSEFKRDRKVKYDKYDSYRISSPEYNDAVFYKVVNVTPNTPYRVSCMVKTDSVQTETEHSIAGAGICIADTTECSYTITGTTNGWERVELLFNSKDRTEVNIGFRLGSYSDNCKGTAWFSNLKLEVGTKAQDTHWKMACFVVKNLDVNIDVNGQKKHITTSLNSEDMSIIKDNMERLKSSLKTLSDYQMTMDYDIIELQEPITSVTYDEENGYYLSNADMAEAMKPYIVGSDYDYIYTIVRFGNIMHNDDVNKGDWIGLRRYGLFRHWFF